MAILADILDQSTERLTSFEVPRKKVLLLLRWTLFGCLFWMGTVSTPEVAPSYVVYLSLATLFIVNLAVSCLQERTLRATPFEFIVGILDCAMISFVVLEADRTGFLAIFFFTLLIGIAASTRVAQMLLGAVALSSLYLLVVGIQFGVAAVFSVSNLLTIPMFYVTALYFGYQVLHVRDRHAQSKEAFRERHELRVVLNILESITSSLDFQAVMYEMVTRIAEVLDSVRCSILLVRADNPTHGVVIAASDDQQVQMLPIDLPKYPEVQEAIRKKREVIIEDVERSEMLQPCLDELRRLKFFSLMILPVLYRDEVIGTLFLRATRQRSFTPDEVKFCRVIASAAAGAIKNSMLYRSIQEKAHEHEETALRIRNLFDHSPDLILNLDADGKIREANRRVEQISGRHQADVLSLSLDSLIDGLPPIPEMIEKAHESSEPLVLEARLRAEGKRERDLSVTVGAVGEPQGGLILIARDVTEQLRAAALLRQREKLSTIGEIVASVAHELNNPLSGVVGFAQLLAQKNTSADLKRNIDRIVECSDRCQKIVRNLLSFARPTNLEMKPLGLNGVLEKTVDLMEPSLQADGIQVETEFSPDLPYVLADFHQIQQIFTNLITNAQQAITDDRRTRHVTLRTHARDGKVMVEVSDDGPGISPDILPRIFDPFFSTKEKKRGTGLGLSISYGIIRDHGGELLVENRPGEGVTFSTVLPEYTPEHIDAQVEPEREETAAAGRTILVVDDEEVILEIYLQLLQSIGHTVDTASNGLEALRKMESRDYDLVITDIKMPKLTGIEFYEKAIEIKPEMKRCFIFITGDMNSVTGRQHSILTDIPCLLKPVDLDTIKTTIHDLLTGTVATPNPSVS